MADTAKSEEKLPKTAVFPVLSYRTLHCIYQYYWCLGTFLYDLFELLIHISICLSLWLKMDACASIIGTLWEMAIIVSKVCFSWTGVQINVPSPYFISVYLPYCIVWLCVVLFHHGFEVVVIMQKSLVYNKSMTARFFTSQRVKTSNWSRSRQKVFCSIAKLKKWTTFNLHILQHITNYSNEK